MQNKVSIIVTIYNREDFLARCVDSIVCQTYKNIEIILVDDGSTDSSFSIMENYAQKDPRIKIFHKENGGLVSCWKYGLMHVSGKYLTMVDSDDWLEKDAVEKMVIEAESCDADMVVAGAKRNGEGVLYKSIGFTGVYRNDELSTIHKKVFDRREEGFVPLMRPAKLYKTDFFKKNTNHDYNGNLLEDIIYISPLFFKTKCICFIDEPLYIYYFNPNSMSNVKYKIGEMKRYNDIFEYFINNSASEIPADVNKYDILGYFLWIKLSLLLFSDLTKKEKISELKAMMNMYYTRNTIKNYKHIGIEKFICKVLLYLKCYNLIVNLKGTK